MHGHVNVPRFTYDKAYRRDVIMNIAAQQSPDLAISLGKKYSMDLWEINFKHFQWLLLNDKQVVGLFIHLSIINTLPGIGFFLQGFCCGRLRVKS